MAPRKVEFANFILTFGTKLKMLDFLEEIVLPAFTDSSLRRDFMGNRYFFLNVVLLDLGTTAKPRLAIAGRFVMKTVLRREQVYDEERGRLRHDEQDLESAPSAIFVLLLENHKLIYYHETADAPTTAMFRTTAEKFLTAKYMDWAQEEHRRRKSSTEAKDDRHFASKKRIKEDAPPPDLAVVALASEASLAEFVRKYDVLRSIRVEFASVNDELDNDEFFDGLRGKKTDVRATKTTLTHTNPKGLAQEPAIEQLTAAAQEANVTITLDGKDQQGDELHGDNHNFRLRVPLPNMPKSVTDAAERMLSTFDRLLRDGTIIIAQAEDRAREAMLRVRDRFRSR